MKLKEACSLEEKLWPPWQHIQKQRHYFVNKGPCSQSYGFSSSHIWMWEMDYKESWEPKNWCFWTVVLEKTLESPLDCKEIQPVYPKRNQSRLFIGRTDVEAETPILWPPNSRNWLIGKDPDAGKDRGQEEKGVTEDEMVGWHHSMDMSLSELQETVKDREAWYGSAFDHKKLDTTEWLNNNSYWKKTILLIFVTLICWVEKQVEIKEGKKNG